MNNTKLIAVILATFVVGGLTTYFLISQQLKRSEVPAQTNQLEKILIYKGKDSAELFQVDLITRELKSYPDDKQEVLKFTGLPKEEKTDKTETAVSRVFFSGDKSRAIVVFVTYDTTQPPNESELGSYLPVVATKEFLCVIKTRQCSSSNLLEAAEKSESDIWWRDWDSSKNLLFGHPTGEGIGHSSPVVIYDLNKKSSQRTAGYDFLKNEKYARVPLGAFSPSLQKFLMVDDWKILLYNSSDLSKPARIFDISDISSAKDTTDYDRINTVGWSPDEKMLAVGTDRNIYTLDLNTGALSLKFTDTTQGIGLLYWDRNVVQFSPNGRFIVFVDYDDASKGYQNTTDILRAIDLKNNDSVTEILRDGYISLIED